MSRPSKKVSTAPMGVTSAGEILVNAYQLAVGNDLSAAIEAAKASGLPVFVGLVVPSRGRARLLKDVDDAAADVVGRLGPHLPDRKGRGRPSR
jgi:hypothetical protein